MPQNKSRTDHKRVDYNPRWKGYSLIALSSLIQLSSASNVAAAYDFRGHPGVAVGMSAFTLLLVSLVLILDRTQLCIDTFNYSKALDGKLEGYVLIFLLVFWIVAVAFITQVDGIGYLTLNIYFSAWLVLFACLYTLNKWSADKDILSIAELTGVSATLKSWWILFLSSLVVMGTSINFCILMTTDDAVLGVSIGFSSSLLSFFFICVHYKFIEFVEQGGWAELGCNVLSILMWIVATALITQDGGVGATIVGTGGCITNLEAFAVESTNCSVVVMVQDSGSNNVTTSAFSCQEIASFRTPGSNLYVFCWISLAASLHVASRWKAQQALQFAQAQHTKNNNQTTNGQGNNDEDLDDLDDFEDAHY